MSGRAGDSPADGDSQSIDQAGIVNPSSSEVVKRKSALHEGVPQAYAPLHKDTTKLAEAINRLCSIEMILKGQSHYLSGEAPYPKYGEEHLVNLAREQTWCFRCHQRKVVGLVLCWPCWDGDGRREGFCLQDKSGKDLQSMPLMQWLGVTPAVALVFL